MPCGVSEFVSACWGIVPWEEYAHFHYVARGCPLWEGTPNLNQQRAPFLFCRFSGITNPVAVRVVKQYNEKNIKTRLMGRLIISLGGVARSD